MGDKYIINAKGPVGAMAVGKGSTASGQASGGSLPNQEEHRSWARRTQHALVDDEDALDPPVYEALGQFLRIAREIQVEQQSLADVQQKMKDILDGVWAEHAAKGLRSQALPQTLETVKALAEHPAMVGVLKKLVGA